MLIYKDITYWQVLNICNTLGYTLFGYHNNTDHIKITKTSTGVTYTRNSWIKKVRSPGEFAYLNQSILNEKSWRVYA